MINAWLVVGAVVCALFFLLALFGFIIHAVLYVVDVERSRVKLRVRDEHEPVVYIVIRE